MGDDKSWIEKRKSLRMLKSHATQSSSLKKKLGIINRLRNIGTEDFEVLLAELSDENMNRFHTEIVNSLLGNTRMNAEEIHKVVEVVYLYSFDQCFMSYLVASLKKTYTESWAASCIFLEAFYLLKKKDLGTAAKYILKNLKEGRTSYVHYVLTSFEIDCEIFKEFVAGEISNANEKNIENLRKIAEIMHIDHKISLKSDFIDLVKIADHEFDFYGTAAEPCSSSPALCGEQFTPSMLKCIERRMSDVQFLDFIGQNIHDKPGLIEKLWKKRKNIRIIPSLARIFSKAMKSNSGMITSLLSKLEALKPEDLILLSELYKFNIVKAPELFDMLEFYLSRRMIEKLCIVLETAGRFLLASKHTNKQTVDLMERLKGVNCMNVEKIHISNCLSRILSSGKSKLTIIDYLRWFFTSNAPRLLSSTNDPLLARMRESKKFMLIVFMQPSLFGSTKLLADMIELVEMAEFMESFYLNAIPKIRNNSLLFQVVEVLGHLAKGAAEQKKMLYSIKNMNASDEIRLRSMLMLLDMFDQSLHHDVLGTITVWARSLRNREVDALLFNFLEKYQYPIEDSTDSLEREISCMREDDY